MDYNYVPASFCSSCGNVATFRGYNLSDLLWFKSSIGCHLRLGLGTVAPQRSSVLPKRSTRAGSPLAEMFIPPLLDENINSLFTKSLDLSVVLRSPIHVHNCAFCMQESWLDPDFVAFSLLTDTFELHRQDNKNKT